MVEVCLWNATRCSNLREMRVKDFENATMSDLPDSMEINSDRYKTSITYGRKGLHLPMDLFNEFDTFVKIIRPAFVSHNVFIFTSLKAKLGTVVGCQITTTSVSKCLTLSFVKWCS